MKNNNSIIAVVSFKSLGGLSIYKDLHLLCSETFERFKPALESVYKAKVAFKKSGFIIVAESEVGLTIGGSQQLFESFFCIKIQKVRISYIRDYDYYIYKSDKELEISICPELIEKIYLPNQFFVLNNLKEKVMPKLDYYHLTIPHGIRSVAGLDNTDVEYNLNGVNVVMIDTGLYKHTCLLELNSNINVIPVVDRFDARYDERGHGTAMSSVLLSLAPSINYTVIKAANAEESYPTTAFQKATSLNPEIINSSWGMLGFEPQLYLEISNAVSKGIICVFSAGNSQDDNPNNLFQTISHPDVLTVGGCMPHQDQTIEVSDISSSFDSYLFTGRHVPDLCGICGLLPYAHLILLPSQPECLFDKSNGLRDGTETDDGWFVSSGTSAAAAYITGLIAQIKGRHKNISQTIILEFLKKYCIKVNRGNSFMNDRAKSEYYNKAVGYGFVKWKRDGE